MANDFSGDSDIKLYCKFESGALEDCEISGVDFLTNVNTVGEGSAVPAASPVDGGSGGADLEYYNSEYFTVADGDLPSGFPSKGGTPTSFSIGIFYKPEGSNWANYQGFVTKYTYQVSGFNLFVGTAKVARLGINWSGGWQNVEFGTAFTDGNEYFICATYNHSTRSYRLHVYDITSSQPLDDDVTGTATSQMAGGSEALKIGRDGYSLDGLIDSLVISSAVWTTDEIDQIRAGTYGAGGPSGIPIPVAMYHYMHH